MSKEFLKGKVGTGIRAAWVGEKTATSFAIYVLVRNMSSTAYNFIHGTSLTGVGTQLDLTTGVTIGARITGGADLSVTGVNLLNDPLVYSDADSKNWTGLRIRRFEFTGLSENTEYEVTAYTNAVTATDPTTGKLAEVTWKVKTFSNTVFAGANFSCDNSKFGDVSSNGERVQGWLGQDSWYAAADHIINLGAEIMVCQDDMIYSKHFNQTQIPDIDKWADPINLTTDTVDVDNIKIGGVPTRDCELTTEDALVGTYLNGYGLTGQFFLALLHPATLSMAMRIGVESTDSGDHLALMNNCSFYLGEDTPTSEYADALLVDYGGSDKTFLSVRPTDDANTHWLHGGSTDVAVPDPYDSVSQVPAYANIKTDLNTCSVMTRNHLVLMEYFFGRATGVTAMDTDSWRPCYSTHDEFGTTLALDPLAAKNIWRKREHPLVDIFYLNLTYYGHQGNYNGFAGGDPDNKTFPTNYRVVEFDRTVATRLGAEQKAWIEAQVAASTKPFIVIYTGDPFQRVNPTNEFDFGDFGQPDSIGQMARAELESLMTALQATGKGILVMTGDYHSLCMNREQPNILQLLSVTGWGPALRPFTVDTQTLYGFTGQYDHNLAPDSYNIMKQRGFNYFKVTQNRMYAYNVRMEWGHPLASDIAYFDRTGTEWKFMQRDATTFTQAFELGNSGLGIIKGG